MKTRIKEIVQYLLLLTITVILLWLAIDNIEAGTDESRLGFIISVWNSSFKPYLLVSGLLALVSHYIRAARWKLLLKPAGHDLRTDHSFLSVMVGYFVNLAIPRGGEISRCYNLYRLNRTPIDVSFGTVVAERVIDLFILVSLIAFSLLIEFEQIVTVLRQVKPEIEGASMGLWEKVFLFGSILLTLIILGVVFWKILHTRTRRVQVRVRSIFRGIKRGFYAIFSLEKRGLFLLYSLMIWFLYFLMTYFIIEAFPETNQLSLLDTITIFVIGGIAMAIPLPGGAGSYHVLVPLGLVSLFGIARDEAIAFSFIFHGWQTLIVIFTGLISLLYSQYLSKKNKP